MCAKRLNQKYLISYKEEESSYTANDKKKKILRRILLSGTLSFFLILIIIFTLPETVLTISSLIEYSVIAALVIFLFILLIRYFGILIFSYLYMTEYTFKPTNGFKPFISIIIPIFNEGRIIERSINSLLNLDYPDFEIIMVNDGSTDNTVEVAEKLVGYRKGLYKDIKISLVNKPNGGKASALNLGIKLSEAEYVLCMDGDSLLSPLSLKLAVRHFVNPRIGAVAGNVKVLNRGKFFTDLQALEYLEGLNMARSAQSSIQLVNIIPGPIGLFRKKAVESIGFYAGDTFAEDADITLRLLSEGWKIYYEPNAVSYTEAPEKLHQLLKQRYRWTRGILQSIRKHKKLIINPAINFPGSFILWSMFFEALIWPPMNLAAHLFFIIAALVFGFSSLIFYWWAGLALLDVAAALYCAAAEKEEFRLIGFAVIYRMIFILIIDICKTMSTVEEFLGIKMTWGKLERLNYS
jgi:cellulose synthase/poly-beta-1,6-N-acetylglucosamine synthase-like glycosyltransferase